jgi:glucan phosphoethanolaminetransferase (alkaline phosphatase superfamily)
MKRKELNQQLKHNLTSEAFAVQNSGIAIKTWMRLCINCSVFAAVVITFMDVLLLQRKFNFFTGGFLSVYHLKDPIETALFIGISLISDIGITIPLAALVLWFCSLIRLNLQASAMTTLMAVIGPLVVANIMSYRILEYLGDIFDYQLAFEIAGRKLTEVLSIASAHLFMPVAVLLGAIVLLVFFIVKANGYWSKPLPLPPAIRKVSLFSSAIFLIALVATSIAVVNSESFEQGLKRKPSAKVFAAISETLTDVDRDGYGLLHRPKDPDPFNPGIYPYARETPGNGIDENGVAGDLPADGIQYPNTEENTATWKSRPHVILIVLESFRADLINMMYKGKQITPVLNSLVGDGISADLAFAHIGYTAPSRYHLFSGKLINTRDQTTLIDDFKANGYEVAYFSAQDVSFGGKTFDIGFDRADIAYDARVEPHLRYTTFTSAGSIALPYNIIADKVADFLSGRHTDKPLFLHINIQDAHFPYYHSGIRSLLNQTALARAEISPHRAAELWATYVNTAANVDDTVGRILEAAKRSLKGPAPGIIITADHGESLYDEGFLGHGFVLNDIQTRVPLIVANLPLIIEQPFGHSQLRDTLNRALESKQAAGHAPVLTENPEEAVFQYLGALTRPSQIALLKMNGRTIYDFRTNRVRISDKPWRFPSELSDEEFTVFRDLVMLIERRASGA